MSREQVIEDLENCIRYHNEKYFKENAPEISDVDFDKLVRSLKKLSPGSDVLDEIADSQWFNTFEQVERETPMLSLDKCYTDEEFQVWAKQFSGGFVAMPKIDGCALELTYEDGELVGAATRGNGRIGESVLLNAREVEDIPHKISIRQKLYVRGEIFMKKSVFKEFADEFANPRNLAAGAIRQKFASETKKYKLSFLAYDIRFDGQNPQNCTEMQKLESLEIAGFQPIFHRYVTELPHALKESVEWMTSRREYHDFETDGIVYKTNELTQQQQAGETAHHPRYAIAYKFQGQSAGTILKDVQWQVARSGRITPVGIINPVSLDGASISKVTLHHAGVIKDCDLHIGDEILIVRRGGVIPHFEKVLKRSDVHDPVECPSTCPSCGGEVEHGELFTFCKAPETCKSSRLGLLEHFAKTLDIEGFGPSIIEKLFDAWYLLTPSDFFKLTVEKLAQVNVSVDFGRKLCARIYEKTKIPLALFLESLGIEGLGTTTSQLLAKKFLGLNNVLFARADDVLEISGIGETTYTSIFDGFEEKADLIADLLQHVEVLDHEIATGVLSGKTFIFTGKLTAFDRATAEKQVTDKGATIVGSVSKDLDFIVVGEKAGSKLDKAKALQAKGEKVKIIHESSFWAFLENPESLL